MDSYHWRPAEIINSKGLDIKLIDGWEMKHDSNGDIAYIPQSEYPSDVCVEIKVQKNGSIFSKLLGSFEGTKKRKSSQDSELDLLETLKEEKKNGKLVKKHLRFIIQNEYAKCIAIYSAIPDKFEEYLEDARDIGYSIEFK